MAAAATEFGRAVAPMAELLSDLMDGGLVSRVQIRNGLTPSASSPFMDNLMEAERLKGTWCLDPANEVQNTTLGKLGMAEDHIRAFVELISADQPFAYAHHTVARAAFEALAWTHHFGPWHQFRDRLQRTLNHQIQAAYDLVDLESQIGEPIQSGIKADKYLAAAGPLALQLTGRDRKFLKPGPPKMTSMLTDLFGSEETARIIYKQLSWSAHGKPLGLASARQVVDGANELTGQSLVGAGPDSTNVYILGIILATKYLAEAGRLAEYSGWLDNDWKSLTETSDKKLSAMSAKVSELTLKQSTLRHQASDVG